ncbi:MAG TPA: hypothetical protein ENI79_06250, partial [Rhodospirillales bacterium]|nr:hypothetical protein [Rhodospirillales bacterium]
MDILSAKQKVFTDASPEAVKNRSVSLGDFSINFGDLLSRAGVDVDKDAYALDSFSGIGKVAERAEQPAPPEKQNYEQDYERNDDAPR